MCMITPPTSSTGSGENKTTASDPPPPPMADRKTGPVRVVQQLLVFEGHTDAVFSCCFSPDGTRALSGSDDCTLRLWELEPDVRGLRACLAVWSSQRQRWRRNEAIVKGSGVLEVWSRVPRACVAEVFSQLGEGRSKKNPPPAGEARAR